MKRSANREFQWISSVGPRAGELESLAEKMKQFYSGEVRNRVYRPCVDNPDNHQPHVETALITAIRAREPRSILEVGCGSGRMLKRLRELGYSGQYTGIEMSPDVITRNQQEFPKDTFAVGGVAELKTSTQSYDALFAYFVFEHLVYPEAALRVFMSRLNPGGSLFLVFPDYVEMQQLPSQQTGYFSTPFRQALKQGKILSGLVGLFDSRVRLPQALRSVHKTVGAFPINANPTCLSATGPINPDEDAVYIASKHEVEAWAKQHGHLPSFPAGTEGAFKAISVIEIRRQSKDTR